MDYQTWIALQLETPLELLVMSFSLPPIAQGSQLALPLKLVEVIRESTLCVSVDQHLVDGVLIIKLLEEYRTQAKEMQVDMDATPKGGLYFDGEKISFNAEEDDLLDNDDEVYMVDIRGSL